MHCTADFRGPRAADIRASTPHHGDRHRWEPGVSMALKTEWGAVTHRGQVRTRNEDAYVSWLAEDRSAGILEAIFAVADGMGGHPGGDRASRLAADALQAAALELAQDGNEPERILTGAFERAHEAIRGAVKADPALDGMGTTLTALMVTTEGLFAAHVGDSRLYELTPAEDGGRIVCRTTDHTLAQEQSDAGVISGENLEEHPLSHILTRSVGAAGAPRVQILELGSAGESERFFILCSDGLIRVVQEEEMPGVVAGRDPEPAAQALVELANERGAPDNVTVLVARVRA
ncbi:MAG: serine/threonine-protein phosphatase [Candidatus Eisenbacteria bacterium]|nr:serine/threonine-protein phosphatase [Candidatus Eisenbacteria bacterium]